MYNFKNCILTKELQEKFDLAYKEDDIIMHDKVVITRYNRQIEIANRKRVTYPTDYAILCGAKVTPNAYGPMWRNDRFPTNTWYRDTVVRIYKQTSRIYNFRGVGEDLNVCIRTACVVPKLYLNTKKVLETGCFKVNEVKDLNKLLYHTIEFKGVTYPQTREKYSNMLEKLFNEQRYAFTETGKSYPGYIGRNGKIVWNKEYQIDGKKYVRVKNNCLFTMGYLDSTNVNKFKDGTLTNEFKKEKYVWVRVEPIKFKMTNWKHLPKEINPNGLGDEDHISILADEALIAGIPFNYENCSNVLYQNSVIRAFLNGYNLQKVLENGNGKIKYANNFNEIIESDKYAMTVLDIDDKSNSNEKINNGWNFEGTGFIDLAFNDFELAKNLNNNVKTNDCICTNESIKEK